MVLKEGACLNYACKDDSPFLVHLMGKCHCDIRNAIPFAANHWLNGEPEICLKCNSEWRWNTKSCFISKIAMC